MTSRASALGRALAVGMVTGLVVTFVGVYAYSFLARSNLRTAPDLPWSAVLAAPLLWLFWRYLGGAGWPRRTAAYRARMRRANPVPRAALGTTIAAGSVGVVFVLAAITFSFRLMDLPVDALRSMPADQRPPASTALPLLLMLAVVAGVCEEVGVRGYLQKAIEEVGGPIIAVVVSALTFTLLHANHVWFLQQAVPMFVAAIWYGYLTFAARSIYPMIAVHTVLDIALFWYYDVAGADLPAAVSSDGFSPAFWANLAVAVACGAAAFALTVRVAKLARSSR